MYRNRKHPTFVRNQNTPSAGTRNGSHRKSNPRRVEIVATTGRKMRSSNRRRPKENRTSSSAAPKNTTTGVYASPFQGRGRSHPPRNRSVARQLAVTMLAYSAVKNIANFMLLYSV